MFLPVFLFALVSIVSPAFAVQTPPESGSARFGCDDLRRAALELSVHAYNLSNRTTTRTPQGGPFRRRTVECRGPVCAVVIQNQAPLLVHQPGHPDADSNGHVRYPAISVGSEFASVNAAAAELSLMAKNSVCGASSISSPSAAVIKYERTVEAASDTLSFDSNGRVTSWSRVGLDGRSYVLQFHPDGTASNR